MYWRRIPRNEALDANVKGSCQFYLRENANGFSPQEASKKEMFLADHTLLVIYGKMYRSMYPLTARYYDYFVAMKLEDRFYAADPLAGRVWDVVELTANEAKRIFALFGSFAQNKDRINPSDIQCGSTQVDGFDHMDQDSPLIGAYYFDVDTLRFEDYSYPYVPFCISEIEEYNPFRKNADLKLLPRRKRKQIQHQMESFISGNGSRKMCDHLLEIGQLYRTMGHKPGDRRIVPGIGGQSERIETKKLPFFTVR